MIQASGSPVQPPATSAPSSAPSAPARARSSSASSSAATKPASANRSARSTRTSLAGMARLVGINHVALEVDDIDAALEFYGRLFGFELRGRGPGMAFIDAGDQFLALGEARTQPPDDDRHFGLVVDDREAVRAALADEGFANLSRAGCASATPGQPDRGRRVRVDPVHQGARGAARDGSRGAREDPGGARRAAREGPGLGGLPAQAVAPLAGGDEGDERRARGDDRGERRPRRARRAGRPPGPASPPAARRSASSPGTRRCRATSRARASSAPRRSAGSSRPRRRT